MRNILLRTLAGFGVLSLALGLPLVAMADALSQAQVAKVDAIVRAGMANQHLVGVEVAIGRNGTTIFSKGYGLRDREKNLPVTGSTVFLVGSNGKQFTAASVMLLVQQGKVQLDDKIGQYLPDVPHGSEITVRELLDQTSGLHDYLENKKLITAIFGGTWTEHRPASYYVGLTKGLPLQFTPGTKWAYSNTNYEILGMLVAKESGEPYEKFVSDNILKPQGLDSMQFPIWSIPPGDDVSRGYTYGKGTNALVPRYDMSWAGAAGALASNAPDLVKWDGAFFGGKVITPASVRIATTPPNGITMGLPPKSIEGQIGQGYAFGWVVGHDEGRKLIWHNGGVIGARTVNMTFPGDGLDVVVFTNATTGEPETIALRIARLLYGG